MNLPSLPPFIPSFIAFDLDGTLINDAGFSPPQSSIRAIRRLKSLGISTAAITGRSDLPPELVSQISFSAFATNNGGSVVVSGKNIIQHYFSPEDLKSVLNHDLNKATVVVFTVSNELYVDIPKDIEPERWIKERGYKPLKDLPETKVSKIGMYHPDVALYASKLRSSHSHLILTGAQAPYPNFLTITPAGANKSTAFIHILEALNLDKRRSMAFGDSDNDIVMLESAAFAAQVGNLPLLNKYADVRLENPTQLGEYLTELANHLAFDRLGQ